MSRIRAPYVFAGAAVAAVVIAVFASGVFNSSPAKSSGADNSFATSIATVKRETLSSQSEQSATLGYADSWTIVLPGGTASSALLQANQGVTTAQSQLATATAMAASDSRALAQAQAALAADREKLAVDCAGSNAGASASSGSSAGLGATPCATDSQSMTTDEQTLTQAEAKVASDKQAVSAAKVGLSSAQTGYTSAQASATVYGSSSTYTELPALGLIVERGQTLYEIDGDPVVLLYGSAAAWRAFATGMSPGADVAELNANLRALGYSAPTGDAFTGATVSAIDAFQAARGMPQTGELLLGSVVFEPSAVRVTTVTPTLGATVQPGPVLGVSSTKRIVTIELDAGQQGELKVGDAVSITLPDNSTTPGRVSFVGKVATTPSSSDQSGGSSSPTIEVDVTPTDPAATGSLDQAPVNVSITEATAKNVLAVPVDSLLALASGGYAVEEVKPGGVHELVAVQLGLFDDAQGYVEVQGDLSPGDRIVVPAQ